MTNQNDLIKDEMKNSNNNISYVARVLGLDYYALRKKLEPQSQTLHSATEPEPADIRTLGREKFKQYVIAVKPAGSSWPAKYDAIIADARRKFDAGTHEMFQSNDNGWVVQYLVPYLIPRERRTFFATMIVMK